MSTVQDTPFDLLLIPVKKAVAFGGVFRWPKHPIFASPAIADDLPLGQLVPDCVRRRSARPQITHNAFGPATLRVTRDKSLINPDSYRLAITPDGIQITAATDAGAYYAIQTLRDLIAIYGLRLPLGRIDDAPDFSRRGVYHDCSRGKVPTLDTLKALVERLARFKINELQLYIENVFTFKQHPDIGRGDSPFTPDDILSLQDHCRLHHVRLVGSLASFGHLEKILALPKYLPLAEMPGFRGLPGGMTLCPVNPGSIRLIAQLYDEFIPLFKADDFNVCCDETWELGRGKSKKQADRLGLGRVYLEFFLKIHRLCQKHGKRMNAWADIVLKHPEVLSQIPRDIVLLNWEYESDGANIANTRKIADAKIPFGVCPGTSSWLTHGSRLANAMQNVAAFSHQGRRHNAVGLINTDWGDQGHRNFLGASLHGFAHGAAHAWHGRGVDEKRFTEKFCRLVFNQPPRNHRLADALRLLGSTYSLCGKVLPNRSLLYPALVEPLLPNTPPTPSAIAEMTVPGLRRILDELSKSPFISESHTPDDDFERLALRELALAAVMDRLACQRALIGKSLRAGDHPGSQKLKSLADQMRHLTSDFQKLWLRRNRPSRLRDNSKLFQQAQREALRLAKKH